MKYSVDVDRTVNSLAYCLQRINYHVYNMWDWRVSINAGGIDYGIYFNFDIENKELEISNQPQYDESLNLDEIIAAINKYYEETEE